MVDVYHACRWCKFFEDGMCMNNFQDQVQVNVYKFFEEGTLSEAIKEGFGELNFDNLKQALSETKLSKKRQSELMKICYSELEDGTVNWVESIDTQVSLALIAHDFNAQCGVEIKNPSEFYCCNFE